MAPDQNTGGSEVANLKIKARWREEMGRAVTPHWNKMWQQNFHRQKLVLYLTPFTSPASGTSCTLFTLLTLFALLITLFTLFAPTHLFKLLFCTSFLSPFFSLHLSSLLSSSITFSSSLPLESSFSLFLKLPLPPSVPAPQISVILYFIFFSHPLTLSFFTFSSHRLPPFRSIFFILLFFLYFILVLLFLLFCLLLFPSSYIYRPPSISFTIIFVGFLWISDSGFHSLGFWLDLRGFLLLAFIH